MSELMDMHINKAQSDSERIILAQNKAVVRYEHSGAIKVKIFVEYLSMRIFLNKISAPLTQLKSYGFPSRVRYFQHK
jgi:hypothetical protein